MINNYTNLSSRSTTGLKNGKGVANGNPTATLTSTARKSWLGSLLLIVMLMSGMTSWSQVSLYSFSQSNETYSEISGGTVLGTATAANSFDSQLWAIANGSIPFNFNFNGTNYTGCSVNSNGFITFGATTSTSGTTTAISSTVLYSGAIAAWSGDLNGGFLSGLITSETRWEVVGTAPNREFVIQFKNWRTTFSSSTTNFPFINFQIRLAETSNLVKIVYGPMGYAIGTTSVSGTRQVGLRGASNADFNNRTNVTSIGFNASTQGVANFNSQAYNTTLPTPGLPTNGLTYTYTPPVLCSGTPVASTINGAAAVCANTGTTLSLSSAYLEAGITYQWKSSTTSGGPYTNMGTATTQATGNLAATTYYVCDITCSGTSTFTTAEKQVLVNALPVISTTSSSPSYCNPGGTAVTLTSGGALTYVWSPAAGLSGTTGDIVSATPSITTTYTVTGTDGNGCLGTATVAVASYGIPQGVSATATPATICTGGTTTLNAFASIPSTVNQYSFAASTGAALDTMAGATQIIGTGNDDTPTGLLTLPFAFNFNGSNYTTYSVSPDGWVLFGAAGISQFSNIVTSGSNTPKLYPHWDDMATGTTGNVSTLTIGTAPNRVFIVQWFVTCPRATTGPANSTFQAWMYEGSNKVEFRYGAMGVSGSSSVGLTGSTSQFHCVTLSTDTASTATANNANAIAPTVGDSYVFTPPTATFAWSPAVDVVSPNSQSTATNAIAATQSFSVVASNNGCNAAPASTTVTINPLVCSAATFTSPNCAGSNFTVSANISGGGAPYSYVWSDGAGGVYPDAATITANLPAGTYNFTCAVSDSCGSTCNSNVTVVVNGLPSVTVAPTSALYCNPSTPIAITASGAATYAWSPASGLSAATGSVVNASPSATSTYTVVGTDANGCVAPSVTSTITVEPGPTAITVTPSAGTICNGSLVTLNAAGGNVATSSTFVTVSPVGSIQDNTTTSQDIVVAGLPASATVSKIEVAFDITHTFDGDLRIDLQAPNGKIVNLVNRRGGGGANFTGTVITSDTSVGSVALGAAPFTGTFSADLADLALPTSTLIFSELFTVPNGTWILSVGDFAGGDFGTLNVSSIKVFYSAPTVTSWTASSGTLYTSVSPDVAYVAGDNAAVLYARPTTATTYTASASLGGCTSTGNAVVAVNQLPVFSVAPITICNGTTGTLVTSSLESNSYSWTPVLGGSTLSGASVMVSPSETTTYNVTATSNTTVPACSSSQQVTVTVNEPGTIVSGTATRTVSPGQLTTFEVVTTGLVTYQWQVNNNVSGWQNIMAVNPDYSGENSAVLSLQNITLGLDTYQYRCLVTGLAPCVTLTPIVAILNVTNTGFSTQPADVNLCGQSSTSFSIVTTGDEPYNVQWQMSTDGGASFNDIFDGADASGLIFSGVNEFSPKTLFVSGITTAHSGYQFKCQLDFFLDSGIATLTVNTPVTLTNNFSTAPVVRCNAPSAAATSFGISTTGSVADVEWKYATSASGPWNTIAAGTPAGASYSGATSNTLSVTTSGTTPVGNYYYKAFVTGAGSGPNKCADLESVVATVSVANPIITVSPTAATYCTPGSAVTLTAGGSDINSYSWTASGFTTTTGTSVAVTPSVATTYTVTGTDSNGCTNTAQATINVGASFNATATSSAATVCPGNPVTLTAASALINLVPTPMPISNYTFENTTDTFASIVGEPGTTALTLASVDDAISAAQTLPYTFNYGGNNFTSFKMNANGWIQMGGASTSTTNYSSLSGSDNNIIAAFSRDLNGNNTTSTSYYVQTVGAVGSRITKIQWTNFRSFSSVVNPASGTVQIWLHEGSNKVEIRYGAFTTDATKTSTGTCQVGLRGSSNAAVNMKSLSNTGSWATPTVGATTGATVALGNFTTPILPDNGRVYRFSPLGNGTSTYTYAWSSAPAGFTASTAVATTNPSVNTTYNVVATSSTGCTASASVTVSVDAAPAVITTQPLTQQLCQGTTATLSVVASSATALSYQWYKGGVAITGNASATTPTLTLTGTTPATSGSYTVTVTNCSTVTSDAAVLTVYPTPTAVAPAAQAYCIDATVPATPLTGTPSGVTFNITGGAAIGLANQTGVTQIPSFAPTAAGTATISITPVANGCPGAAVTYTLRINALPTAPLLSVNTPICEGSSLDFASIVAVQQGYSLNSNSNVAFIDISASGTAVTGTIGDDTEHALTIPAFIYNGTTYTTALVGNNGALTFGITSGNIGFTNTALPGSTANLGGTAATICALWDDLFPGTGGSIRTQTLGGKYIVQWTQEDNFGATGTGTVTFQIQLDLTTSQIHLVYPDIVYGVLGFDNAQTATIGLNFSSSSALQYSFNTASILNGQSLTFTPAAYSYAWSGPSGFTSAVSNPSIANALPAATGNYTLEITNGNGCKSSSTIAAVVHPTPTVVAPASQIYYSGFATTAMPLVGTPSNVTFNISGGAASGLADVNGVTEIPSFIPTATPSTVTITPVANGCVGASVTFQISFIPVVVNIESNVCGSVNNGLNNQINCTNISIPGYTTTGYQFEVTNNSTGEVSIVFSSQHHFKLTDANNYSYGTTFTIRVAAVLDGNVQGYYGDTCSLTTTEVRTTKVIPSQCGSTLVFVNSTINANSVSSTNLYRFRVALASAPTVTYLVERTVPNFKLTDVVGLPIQYNTEYLVDVQVRVKLAGFEAWSQYGERCSVFTPEAPETSLIASQCEDYAVTSDTELINVIPFPGATTYRFRLTGYDEFGDVNYQQTVDSALPSFTLGMFTGLTPGSTYTVGVSMELFGIFTDFGKDCTIIVPTPAKQAPVAVVEPFKATAYPNPFAANFMINVKTSSTSVIAIKVYDMVGRLVEQKTATVTELENAPIGNNYPAGVYNVVVTQDDTVQTVRVVKR